MGCQRDYLETIFSCCGLAAQIEDLRGKVAVMRGPIVYRADFPEARDGAHIWRDGVFLVAGVPSRPASRKDFLGGAVVLEGKALTARGCEKFLAPNQDVPRPQARVDGTKRLYTPLTSAESVQLPDREVIDITLIPHYAWVDRGAACMAVWLPLAQWSGSDLNDPDPE